MSKEVLGNVRLSDDEIQRFANLPHIRPLLETMGNVILQGSECYVKFTCLHCGSRQTIDRANAIYTSGVCEECKGVSDFKSPLVELGLLFVAGTPNEIIDYLSEQIIKLEPEIKRLGVRVSKLEMKDDDFNERLRWHLVELGLITPSAEDE